MLCLCHLLLILFQELACHKLIIQVLSFRLSFIHDDVTKWKHFSCYWPFVQGIQQSPVNSPHKSQSCRALMFSLICAWINAWVNNRETGDLRCHHAHYDVIVMLHWHISSFVLVDLFDTIFMRVSNIIPQLFLSDTQNRIIWQRFRILLSINPWCAGTELSRFSLVNIMAADALAPYVARTSAAMILTI